MSMDSEERTLASFAIPAVILGEERPVPDDWELRAYLRELDQAHMNHGESPGYLAALDQDGADR